MRIKICGIRHAEQGHAIAKLGATALGFICVSKSPRYVVPSEIRNVTKALPAATADNPTIDRVGVFVNASIETIRHTVIHGHLNAVQLHGDETPEFCQQLRHILPTVEQIKAFRIRSSQTLSEIPPFADVVDSFLLDAYHPKIMGGTGQTLNWSELRNFTSDRPWFLAGGLNPSNVSEAISLLKPDGIDLSSGVEISPGNKDLKKIKELFEQLIAVHN